MSADISKHSSIDKSSVAKLCDASPAEEVMLKLVLLLAFLVAIAVAQEVAWNGTLHDRGKRIVEGQRCALSRARAPLY